MLVFVFSGDDSGGSGRCALVLFVVEHARFAGVRIISAVGVNVAGSHRGGRTVVETEQGGQVGRRVQEYSRFHGRDEHRFPGR